MPGGLTSRRRPPLPSVIYREHIAPFLRFQAPLPGMLYAFGGRNQRQGTLRSVEMLDSRHGCWVPCPEMPRRRAGSAAAALPDGRLMVLGGYDERGISDGLLSSCDIYDPTNESWHENVTAPLNRARWGHGCAALGGLIYVVGGCSLVTAGMLDPYMETLSSCEAYDPVRNRWENIASLQVPRSGCRVVALAGRYLAAVGGCLDVFGQAETLNTVEVFDVVTGRWELVDDRLGEQRTSSAVAAIDDTRLFIAGGAPSKFSAEVFRLAQRASGQAGEAVEANNTPEMLLDMKEGRMGCQAAIVSIPRVAAVASAIVSSDAQMVETETEGESDSCTETEQEARNAATAQVRAACEAYVSCVLIVGGERCGENEVQDGRQPKQLNTCAAFDLNANKWLDSSMIPKLATSRTTTALCVGMGRVCMARLKQCMAADLVS